MGAPRKLTSEQVRTIKAQVKSGTSATEIAKRFGVTTLHIYDLAHGLHCSEIAPELTTEVRGKRKNGDGSIVPHKTKYIARYSNKHIGMYSSREMAQKAIHHFRDTGLKIKE